MYRVRARAVGSADDIVMELFDRVEQADGLFTELTGEQSLLWALQYDSYSVTKEELCHGDWCTVVTRLVVR